MSAENDGLRSINRRPAKSGKVDYGDPIILHETSRTRVVLMPFFISHSDHTELASKIITYKKDKTFNCVVNEEKSVSLPGTATRTLLAGLNVHLAVAEENSDGQYLLIRVSEGTAQLGSHDPAQVATALTRVLGQKEIIAHLQNTELTTELTSALRSSIRLSEMRSAVAALRAALDQGDDHESTYQTWCEKHSWAFGHAYVVRDDIREISPGDHLDLILPTIIAGYRDIVELKRPSMEVLRWDDSHRNFYFSSEVSKAIGQCHRYLDVLQEVAAKGLRDHPEIVAYHPRATIVIGRSHDWIHDKLHALHGLNHRLFAINIITYDHLLNQGERLIALLSDPLQPEQEDCDNEYDEEEIDF